MHKGLENSIDKITKEEIDSEEAANALSNPDVAAVVKGSRSRSGSPASCYDITKFEKEKSPFLAVKSLLKPIKKSRLLEKTNTTGSSTSPSDQNTITDWRKVGEHLRPRKSPLSLQSNTIKLKVYWIYKNVVPKTLCSQSSVI